MARIQLVAMVDQELGRRVQAAAENNDQSISEWIEDLVRRRITNAEVAHNLPGAGEELTVPAPGFLKQSRGHDNPPELIGEGKTAADVIIEDWR